VSGSTVTRVQFIRGDALKYISTDGDGVGREQSAEDFIAGLGLGGGGGLDNASDIAGGVLIHTGDGVTAGELEAGGITGRNGLTPVELDIFGTYTSDTSFEKLRIGYSAADSGYLISQEIGSAGGTARDIKIGHRNAAGTFSTWCSISPAGAVLNQPSAVLQIGAIGIGSPSIKLREVEILRLYGGKTLIASGVLLGPTQNIVDSSALLNGNLNTATSGIAMRGNNSSAVRVLRVTNIGGGPDPLLITADGSITARGTATIIPPTTDPGFAGALWNDGGTLAISAG